MISLAIAAAFALALTPLVVVIATHLHLLDVPNDRSLHGAPTPRGGGVAVMCAAIVGVAAEGPWATSLWALLVGASALGLLGLIDDRISLPALPRLGVQLAMPLVIVAAVVDSHRAHLIVLAPVVIVLIAGFVNAFNFMDGINGISGFQTIVVGASLGALCSHFGATALSTAGWAVAGAAIGFLPFNAVHPRLFLGDVGSYFLGFWLAGLAVLAVDAGAPVLVVAAPFLLYVADTSTVLIRRWRRGERLTEAHREHTYQRISRLGYPHLLVAVGCAGLSACCAGLMWAARDSDLWVQTLLFGVCLLLIACYLALPNLIVRRTGRELVLP